MYPTASGNFKATTLVCHETPATCKPLFVAAAIVPATCVPWLFPSMGSLSELTKSQPWISSTYHSRHHQHHSGNFSRVYPDVSFKVRMIVINTGINYSYNHRFRPFSQFPGICCLNFPMPIGHRSGSLGKFVRRTT